MCKRGSVGQVRQLCAAADRQTVCLQLHKQVRRRIVGGRLQTIRSEAFDSFIKAASITFRGSCSTLSRH